MRTLTRLDFNNILNYYDIRSNEFVLSVNNEFVESEYFTGHLTSNTDVVTDYVSVRKVKKLLEDARSYCIKIKKNYPFHEAIIDDAVEVSCKHLYTYTPVLVAALDSTISVKSMPGLPAYYRVFEGDKSDQSDRSLQPVNGSKIDCRGKSLLLILQPNEKLQRELVLRVFRKKINSRPQIVKTVFSLSERNFFYENVKKDIDFGLLSEKDSGLFRHTLLQIWPCGARGRLSSYILLRENTPNLEADLISWNTTVSNGEVYSFSGQKIAASEESGRIAGEGTGRYYGFKRTSAVDKMLSDGIIQYRRKDHWKYRGWVEYVSPLDPTITVRSDGKFRWLKFPHDGVESVERLSDGHNIAIGASFIERECGQYFTGKKVLAAGLGLGLIQRRFNSLANLISIEKNPAVVDIFRTLYPEEAINLKIEIADIYQYIAQTKEKFDTILFDIYDPENQFMQIANVENAIRCLNPGGTVIINKNVSEQDTQIQLESLKADLNVHVNELEMNQKVIMIKN